MKSKIVINLPGIKDRARTTRMHRNASKIFPFPSIFVALYVFVTMKCNPKLKQANEQKKQAK